HHSRLRATSVLFTCTRAAPSAARRPSTSSASSWAPVAERAAMRVAGKSRTRRADWSAARGRILMHSLFKHASFALTIASVGLSPLPARATAQAAQPAGQTATSVSVDCDTFADGQHEVPIVVVTKPSAGATLPAGPLTIQGAALDCHADVGTGINRVS